MQASALQPRLLVTLYGGSRSLASGFACRSCVKVNPTWIRKTFPPLSLCTDYGRSIVRQPNLRNICCAAHSPSHSPRHSPSHLLSGMADRREQSAGPLFRFGVLADVQYADKENGSYENQVQRYREAPGKLAAAVAHFNGCRDQLSFVLTLGDIIDGNETDEKTECDFEVVMAELSKLEVRAAHHVLGNHCLALPRSTLLQRLAMADRFYHTLVHPGWRLAAEELMARQPLGKEHPQMATWNGAIGQGQLAWLRHTLAEAEQAEERVIVAMHHPLLEGAAPPSHLVWNHQEVMAVLLESPSVAAVFAGHYHVGGYAQKDGVHFVTVEAILEASPGSVAHGVVEVYGDCLRVKGCGSVTSRELQLRAS
eukprot:jgi/Mesen1/8901/ME000537S08298